MQSWPPKTPSRTGIHDVAPAPDGGVWYCSLAGSFIAKIDRRTGESQVAEPPTPSQGARRVWSDSRGRIWVSEWATNAMYSFDPKAEKFERHAMPRPGANIRQILGGAARCGCPRAAPSTSP